MKKWGKFIPVAFQVATVLCLILAGIAGYKWGA